MTEHELIGVVADSARVSRDQAWRMIDALADIIRRSVRTGEPLPLASFGAFCSGPCQAWSARAPGAHGRPDDPPPPLDADDYQPTESDVETVIARARNHALGIDFLLNGEPGAVATVLDAHVFAVEAARRRFDTARSLDGCSTG